jgi:hypothetical protein
MVPPKSRRSSSAGGAPMSFHEYIKKETEVAERSAEEYRPELEAFAELAGFFERLAGTITIAERRALIPGELLLVVTNQMFGAGSQMLRTRGTDALALTRRAIEAAAIAYRIWQHPELAEVYANAFPNHANILDPHQWHSTKEHRQQFSTTKLFDQPGDVFAGLKAMYGLTSAMASHAGIGALAGHRDGHGAERVATFLGGDPREITDNWYTLMAVYTDIFKVFVRIMRGNAADAAIDLLVQDFLSWQDRTAAVSAVRAPWARQTLAAFQRSRQSL